MTRAVENACIRARLTARLIPIAAVLFVYPTACIGDAPDVRSNDGGASGAPTGKAGRGNGLAGEHAVAGSGGLAGATDGGPDTGDSGEGGASTGSAGTGSGGTESGGTGGSGGVGIAGQGGAGGSTGPACDKTKPFGAPKLIPGINHSTMRTESGRLSPDGLTIYFDAWRSGGLGDYDIYRATRGSTSENFGTPMLVPNVNGPVEDRAAILSPDGRTMYLQSNRNGSQLLDLFVATRSSVAADFEEPETIASLNSSGRDALGSLTADGRTLYFSSNRAGGITSIYMATQDAGGVFGTPSLVPSLNSGIEDGDPVISADNLTMYFSSHRTITGSNARGDVLMARRSTVNGSFSGHKVLTELSSEFTDFPTWISPDECTIIISSSRVRGASDYDIYWATRPK